MEGLNSAPGLAGGREIQLISFKVGGEEFGVAIDQVKEILKMSPITPVPKSPAYLKGMMNLRGTIIPVLDLKQRLKQGKSVPTPRTRILVLSVGDDLSGIVVDEVSRVQRIAAASVEPPPQVTRGIDKFFLDGVAKPGDNRLILMLNLREVLEIEISKARKTVTGTEAGEIRQQRQTLETIEEEQPAVFSLGEEEFGIDIAVVNEILKVGEITAVPNVPPYIRGIRGIRDAVIPIIDMRRLIGMESQEESHGRLIQRLKQSHRDWAEQLKESLRTGKAFTRSTDPTQCELGKLLEYQRKHDVTFGDMYKKIKDPHDELHLSAAEILRRLKSDPRAVQELFSSRIVPLLETILYLLEQLEEKLKTRDLKDQRILIVAIKQTTVGLLVDKVSEVTRLPKSIIDTTPAVISSYGREIRGIARLNHGTRLILMLDETLLLSGDEMEAIAKIQEERGQEEQQVEKVAVKERQFVVFSVEGDEFGITIDKVREIFKPDEITPVPKAPAFIKGVTNLRGNIIPVVDVKERFGVAADMEESGTQPQETAPGKILVTLVKDTKIGLLVDSVQEVLRIPENQVEDAPSLVLSNADAGYLEGIAKLENGKRIILLLTLDEIMSKKEFAKLRKIKQNVLERHPEDLARVNNTPHTPPTPRDETMEAPVVKTKKPRSKKQ